MLVEAKFVVIFQEIIQGATGVHFCKIDKKAFYLLPCSVNLALKQNDDINWSFEKHTILY